MPKERKHKDVPGSAPVSKLPDGGTYVWEGEGGGFRTHAGRKVDPDSDVQDDRWEVDTSSKDTGNAIADLFDDPEDPKDLDE